MRIRTEFLSDPVSGRRMVRAVTRDGRRRQLTLSYDHALSPEENEAMVAKALVERITNSQPATYTTS